MLVKKISTMFLRIEEDLVCLLAKVEVGADWHSA